MTVIQFVTYSVINTPINVFWQNQLEAWFPSNKAARVEAIKENEKSPVQKKGGLDIKNTLIKFGLDQSIGAGINIPLFIGIMGALKGQSMDMIVNLVKEVRFRAPREFWHGINKTGLGFL